jgi:large subunit ribosomal protein L21
LFINKDGSSVIGNPYIEGAKVTGTVEKLVKGAKIDIFKYKRRKKYRRHLGHRPKFHKITISSIEN